MVDRSYVKHESSQPATTEATVSDSNISTSIVREHESEFWMKYCLFELTNWYPMSTAILTNHSNRKSKEIKQLLMRVQAQWYNNIICRLSGYHSIYRFTDIMTTKISEINCPCIYTFITKTLIFIFNLSLRRYDWDVMDALIKIAFEMLAGQNVLPNRGGACVLRCPFTLSIHQAWMKRWT